MLEARAEEQFSKARNAERSYGQRLRDMAKQVAAIIEAHIPKERRDEPLDPSVRAHIDMALAKYAEALKPWARTVTTRMLAEVNRRNRTAWERYSQGMSVALRREIQQTPVGETIATLLAEQADLITSLPWDAAREVNERTLAAIEFGGRYPEQEAAIREKLAQVHPEAMEQWIRNRARLIARTETARAASVLTEARAKHIGAESYIWKTAGDWKVRPSHKVLNGTVHRWDDPPFTDLPDYHSHPGQIFNCRCIALPILPG
jgi:SPP1 gp7 family putative phage head morphogenesis protein